MSKKLSDPSIVELTEVVDNARIYVLLMDEPEGSRDRYINASILVSNSNSSPGNSSGNVSSHSATTVNNIVVYASTDGTKIRDSGYSAASFATAAQGTKADSAVQPADLSTYATDAEVATALSGTFEYANSKANISNSVAVSIGAAANGWTNASIATVTTTAFQYANSRANISNSVAVTIGTAGNVYATSIGTSSNAWTNTSIATLPSIFASHVNLTSNISAVLAYANGTANISNSVAVTIGAASNTYAVTVGAASNTYAVTVGGASNTYATSIGAAANGWTNTSISTVTTTTFQYANSKANSANTYAESVGGASNTLATSIGTAGNIYAVSVGTAGNTFATSIGASSNAWTNTSLATLSAIYASHVNLTSNIYTLYSNVKAYVDGAVGAIDTSGLYAFANSTANSANAYAVTIGGASNTYTVSVGAASNAYAVTVGTVGNTFATGIGASSNAWTNASIAGLSAIYASHANLTANMFSVLDSNVGRVGGLIAHDFRATDMVTATNAKGLTFQFKTNATDGLNDTGSYHSVIHMTPWDDASGGRAFQLGFTFSGNSWVRSGVIASGWNAWSQIWTSNNFSYNAFATHTDLTSNASILLAYGNSKANISNSVAISIGASGNGWTNTVAASINSYINASTSGAYTPPTLIANLANLGVSTSNAFIYATSATAWGRADGVTFRSLVGAQAELTLAQQIELNQSGSGDRYSFIDFHSQDSVDYSARIIRNPGANGTLVIHNIGYGDIHVIPSNTAAFRVGSDMTAEYIYSTTGGFYSYAVAGQNSHYWLHDEVGTAKAVTWWNRASDTMNLRNWTASTNILSHSTDAIWRIGSNKVYHEGNILDAVSVLGISDTSVEGIVEKTASHTLVLADKGCMIAMNSASFINVSIPNYGQVAFTPNTRIDVAKWGAGDVGISIPTSVRLNGYTRKVLQFDSDAYTAMGLHMQKANVWHMYGGAYTPLPVTNVQVITTSTSSASTITTPSTVLEGDILILYENSANGSGTPAANYPGGFDAINTITGNNARYVLSYRIATAGDASNTLTGMNGSSFNDKLCLVVRGDSAITSAVVTNIGGQATSANPTAQVVNVNLRVGTGPVMIFGAYGSTGTISPASFSPANDDGAYTPSSDLMQWKAYNTSPANTTIDMDDEGAYNYLQSFMMEFT